MPSLLNWHHVSYPVPDVEAAAEWYVSTLRGEITMRSGFSDIDMRAGRVKQLWVTSGSSTFNLAEGPRIHRPAGDHFFHYAMMAAADDLDDWIQHLESKGVDVLGPYGHGGVSLLSLYFDDPFGYRLELVFDLGDYETAKRVSLERGGALGNPDHPYNWD